MYYRGASAAILVFDITKMSSLNTLKKWVEELRMNGPKDIVISIAGNKADLEDQRVRYAIVLLCCSCSALSCHVYSMYVFYLFICMCSCLF